ncbi:MAG: hypothetical protein B6D45_02560 [Ignavibacteriales bacterium UTCHB3]|nr:MAG: hypothetical protein B6D45_02560 [Ignavibacteriales bacterium UTCHB3]
MEYCKLSGRIMLSSNHPQPHRSKLKTVNFPALQHSQKVEIHKMLYFTYICSLVTLNFSI